ncbi:hypothetical protein BDP27DRAFT_1310014 [Rhodocollybia butyracea]|uniref:CCHC-type domain-containing protein n=1 Tax=Rhodocollybia butyracea TaxID=206335 RepID=A0A9P5QAW6_9AGAR|nr:hypothetical protein BDP27DRAFT_1310014 [Rhodocollybia butyracea]
MYSGLQQTPAINNLHERLQRGTAGPLSPGDQPNGSANTQSPPFPPLLQGQQQKPIPPTEPQLQARQVAFGQALMTTLQPLVDDFHNGLRSKFDSIVYLKGTAADLFAEHNVQYRPCHLTPFVNQLDTIERAKEEAARLGEQNSSRQEEGGEATGNTDNDQKDDGKRDNGDLLDGDSTGEAILFLRCLLGDPERLLNDLSLNRHSNRKRAHSPSGEDKEHKKPKPGKSKFTWLTDETDEEFDLTPRHLEILKLVENHSRDIAECVRLVTNKCNVPYFPPDLWKSVLLDRFIEFEDILADDELPPVSIAFDWYAGWRAYSNALTTIFPSRAAELRKYEQHISYIFRTTPVSLHSRVLAYDRAVRKFVGSRRSVLFDELGKFQHYLRVHVDIMGESVVGRSGRSRSQRHRKRASNEVCRNWNNNRCSNPNCPREHKCFTCGSTEHRGLDCSTSESLSWQYKSG